jgi:hypothetical protein
MIPSFSASAIFKNFNLIIMKIKAFHGTPHHNLLYHKNNSSGSYKLIFFLSNFLDLFNNFIYNSVNVIALLRHKNIDAAFKIQC